MNKKMGYLLFALVFTIGRLFPLDRRKALLFNGHNKGLNGNLLEMKRELERREKEVRILFFAKQEMLGGEMGRLKGVFCFFVVLPFHMATAGRIFLNDNFLPLGYCRPDKRAQIVQLWHGAGAFKKFGLSTEDNPAVRRQVERANRRITHLFVTSKQVIPFYQEAFEIPAGRIFATGVPIADVYHREERIRAGKERFYARFPSLWDKKLLLYTPTFRRSQEENRAILENFPVEELHQALGEEWVILIKMHPKYPGEGILENSFCYNMTDYFNIADLYFVSDMLITDYSSTIVEYVLLDKPIVLYCYDLPEYDRGFYRDYVETAPGPVAGSREELLEKISENCQEREKRHTFAKLQYDYMDTCSASRICEKLQQTKDG